MERKLNPEQLKAIEDIINKGDRVELIPTKKGIKIIHETRKEIK